MIAPVFLACLMQRRNIAAWLPGLTAALLPFLAAVLVVYVTVRFGA
jgi:hypothetical protein